MTVISFEQESSQSTETTLRERWGLGLQGQEENEEERRDGWRDRADRKEVLDDIQAQSLAGKRNLSISMPLHYSFFY